MSFEIYFFFKEHSKVCSSVFLNNYNKESEESEVEKNYTCSICLENIVPPMKFGVLCKLIIIFFIYSWIYSQIYVYYIIF